MRWLGLLLLTGCASTVPASNPAPADVVVDCATPAACIEACAEGVRESCARACDGGDAQSCATVGSIALSEGDRPAAAKAFQTACDGEIAVACDLARSIEDLDAPVEPCAEDDLEACAMACHRGNGASCAVLGRQFASNESASDEDRKTAQHWFELGCALGYKPSCRDAAANRQVSGGR